MTALTDLLAALESGTFPMDVLGPDEVAAYAAFGGSMNGAVWFAEKSLPEYAWCVDRMGQAMVWNAHVEGDAISFEHTCRHTPARALLIAAVKALVAKEAGG